LSTRAGPAVGLGGQERVEPGEAGRAVGAEPLRFPPGADRLEQPTEARAAGAALSHLLDAAHGRGSDRHWLDWEREKTYRILRETHRAA